MRFLLKKDIIYKNNYSSLTWVEAGEYDVERIFDDTRVLINVSVGLAKKQLTLVKLNKGKLIK